MNLAKYLTLCLYSPRTTRLVLRPKLAAVSEFVWILLLSLSLLISKFISSLWLFQWFPFAFSPSLSFAFFLMQFIFVTTFLAHMRLPIEIGVSNSNTTTKISSKTMANTSSTTSSTIKISSIIRTSNKTLRINSKFCKRLYLSFSATNLLYLTLKQLWWPAATI